MGKFIKENLNLITGIIAMQIGMTIFGLMLGMACANSPTLLLLSSILSIAFYLFLVYFKVYEQGQKDGIRIQAGRLNYMPMRGALVALCANALNILLAIPAIIGKACISNVPFFSMDEKLLAEAAPKWAANLFAVCSTVAELLQCMYQGLCKVVFDQNVLTLLLRPLPAILISALAYPLGVRFSGGFKSKKSQNKTDRYR